MTSLNVSFSWPVFLRAIYSLQKLNLSNGESWRGLLKKIIDLKIFTRKTSKNNVSLCSEFSEIYAMFFDFFLLHSMPGGISRYSLACGCAKLHCFPFSYDVIHG